MICIFFKGLCKICKWFFSSNFSQQNLYTPYPTCFGAVSCLRQDNFLCHLSNPSSLKSFSLLTSYQILQFNSTIMLLLQVIKSHLHYSKIDIFRIILHLSFGKKGSQAQYIPRASRMRRRYNYQAALECSGDYRNKDCSHFVSLNQLLNDTWGQPGCQ